MPRRLLRGKVVSAKMAKTVVVMVTRVCRHPRYHKLVRRRRKYLAHDELGVKEGEEVLIQETRPLSRKKRFKVIEVVGGVK